MPSPDPRRLLPIVAVYLPVPIAGAVLSARLGVGASPEGGPEDMVLRGTALTPPLFLPVALLAGAAAARSGGTRGRVGAGLVSLVGLAFLGGSTANLPNDLVAAEAAGSPKALTVALAAVHLGLALALLYNAAPRAAGRGPRAAGRLSVSCAAEAAAAQRLARARGKRVPSRGGDRVV